MKKFLKVISVVVVLFVCFDVVVGVVFRSEIRTVRSVSQVGDNKYLYEMEYLADYDLNEVLEAGIDDNKALLGYVIGKVSKGLVTAEDVMGDVAASASDDAGDHCTSFQAASADGGWYFGRNYDYFKNPSLVTVSHPKDGYASIAVSDMSHFGYGLDKLPSGLKSKLFCLASIYAPLDGVNEKGFCTAIMALPKQPAQQNTGKPVCGTTILMRLWLDRCATVDEAIALLETVDVRHDLAAGSGYHYIIADAQGNSAIVEFDLEDGWKTMITRKPEGQRYQAVTNHLVAEKYDDPSQNPKYGNPHSKSWWRYDTLNAYLSERSGVLTCDEALEALNIVHWKDLVWDNGMVEDTQYSCVYDQSNLTVYLRSWADYETVTTKFILEK